MVCKEFFQALEACHADNWRKWTGGCNNNKNELNMCLRKVVRFPFSCRYVPVPLTGVNAATRGFGAKPGAREGTTEENRRCLEGAAPRRLDGLDLHIPNVRNHTIECLGISDIHCQHLPRHLYPCIVMKSPPVRGRKPAATNSGDRQLLDRVLLSTFVILGK